jgi:hypothetical protein
VGFAPHDATSERTARMDSSAAAPWHRVTRIDAKRPESADGRVFDRR